MSKDVCHFLDQLKISVCAAATINETEIQTRRITQESHFNGKHGRILKGKGEMPGRWWLDGEQVVEYQLAAAEAARGTFVKGKTNHKTKQEGDANTVITLLFQC